MKTLEYKGYTARLEIDLDANVIFGRVEDVKVIITFEAERVRDVRRAFEEAIDDYLASCEEEGIVPERPYSGSILSNSSVASS